MTAIACLLALTAGVIAQTAHPAGVLRVESAQLVANLPGTVVAAAYLKLTNSGGADALLGATSPLAVKVEFHRTASDGGVARMRPVPRVELPANAAVEFKPGGMHLMLTGLRRPLRLGEVVPMQLRLESGSTFNVALPVVAVGGAAHQH